VVYSKPPFGGPEAVLAYLSRYTHRVAIDSRLVACDDTKVAFKWRDYRAEGAARRKIMTLAPFEFIRRFLMHVLPAGFHRIRHFGLFASTCRAANLARARKLIAAAKPVEAAQAAVDTGPSPYAPTCPCCGGRMIVIETIRRGTAGHPHDLEAGIYYRLARGKRETNKPNRQCRSHSAHLPTCVAGAPWTHPMPQLADLSDRDGRVTPHVLRHTAATWLMQNGVDLWTAAGFVGMSPETLQRVYGHHHPDHLRAAAEAIGYGRGTPRKPVSLVVSLEKERSRRGTES